MISIIVIFCIVIVLFSCPIWNSRGTSINGYLGISIKGKISTIENIQDKSISSAILHIGSFPIIGGNLSSIDVIKEGEQIPVAEDGSFEVEIGNLEDRILLLIDNSSVRENMVIGFISLYGDEINVIRFPISQIVSSIDLGLLTSVSDELHSTNSISETEDAFSLSYDQLSELARTDDAFKAVKNLYINYNNETKIFYKETLRYDWMLPSNSDLSLFHTPEEYLFSGYNVSI